MAKKNDGWLKIKTNVFRNDEKPSQGYPDWTGKYEIDKEFLGTLVAAFKQNPDKPVRLNIAFWDATTADSGTTYFSTELSIRKPDAAGGPGYKKPAAKPEPKPQPSESGELEFEDDDIPF